MKEKSHVSHLMREQTPSAEFHSLRKEASLGQPTQIRQLTKQFTKRITKTSFRHATKTCMVYSLPCKHCSPHRYLLYSSTYRQVWQTVFWASATEAATFRELSVNGLTR
jgi:hypothetical protein